MRNLTRMAAPTQRQHWQQQHPHARPAIFCCYSILSALQEPLATGLVCFVVVVVVPFVRVRVYRSERCDGRLRVCVLRCVRCEVASHKCPSVETLVAGLKLSVRRPSVGRHPGVKPVFAVRVCVFGSSD